MEPKKKYQISRDAGNPSLEDLNLSHGTSQSDQITDAHVHFKMQHRGKTQTRNFTITGMEKEGDTGYYILDLKVSPKRETAAKKFLGATSLRNVRYNPERKIGEWTPEKTTI